MKIKNKIQIKKVLKKKDYLFRYCPGFKKSSKEFK